MASKNQFPSQRGFRPTSRVGAASEWGSARDVEARRQDADNKRMEQELVQRAVYGAAGERPGQGYDERLLEEMKNPARPETEAETKFKANPMTFDMLKTVLTRKPPTPRAPGRGGFDPHRDTDKAIDDAMRAPLTRQELIGKEKDGKPIYKTVKRSADEIIRIAGRAYKNHDPYDPRWAQVEERVNSFELPAEPSPPPGFFQKLGNMTKRTGQAITAPFRSPSNSSVDHNAAIEWANANPKDPRAAAIRQKASQAMGR